METCKYNVHMFSGSVWVWHRCVVRVSEVPSKVFVFVFVAVFVFVYVVVFVSVTYIKCDNHNLDDRTDQKRRVHPILIIAPGFLATNNDLLTYLK